MKLANKKEKRMKNMERKDDYTMLDYNSMAYVMSYKTLLYKHLELCRYYGDDNSVYFVPAITLVGFAIELSLKSKIEKNMKKRKFGHDINLLFLTLDEVNKHQIVERTIKFYNMRSKKLNFKDEITAVDFFELLKKNSDTFTTLRYFHENLKSSKSYDFDFLETLMFSLTYKESEYDFFLEELEKRVKQK